MVWDSNNGESGTGVTVYVNGANKGVINSLTAEKVKQFARECQVRKFTVKDEDGTELSSTDFPVMNGSVYIDEYNEAK
jgi:hypothetical protein